MPHTTLAHSSPESVWALGLPLVPFTMEQTVEAVGELIERRHPNFFLTVTELGEGSSR